MHCECSIYSSSLPLGYSPLISSSLSFIDDAAAYRIFLPIASLLALFVPEINAGMVHSNDHKLPVPRGRMCVPCDLVSHTIEWFENFYSFSWRFSISGKKMGSLSGLSYVFPIKFLLLLGCCNGSRSQKRITDFLVDIKCVSSMKTTKELYFPFETTTHEMRFCYRELVLLKSVKVSQ